MNTKNYRLLDVITAAFVGVLIISNVTSTKILILGPFTFDGGTILFPLSYIFGDVLTEVYGYQRARRVIWNGFFWLLMTVLIFSIVQVLPPAEGWNNQAAYEAILGQTPRIVLGSLVAFLAGEFSNSVILAKMKVWSNGRNLWMRTIGSTLVGEGVDTLLFTLIAFAGTLDNATFTSLVVSNYVFKVGVEVAFTPVTYLVVNTLKRIENEDYYDRETNFNPLPPRRIAGTNARG